MEAKARRRILTALLGCAAAAGIMATPASAAPYTVQTLHFDTVVGPANDHHCDVVGDLYRPKSATRSHPAPAILTTNGFGGSKDDQADVGRFAASHGYVVLSYSGLGFGGSGCPIELDDPDWDGKAGSQLVTFLGGGMSAEDGTRVHYVQRDELAHDGRHHRFDPRVGMIGGSYGGEIQFAVAEQDPRVDTIVPIITWNDLSYSLTPNNTDLINGVTSATPGIPKFEWAALFFADGALVSGLSGAQADPSRLTTGCPNFNPSVCPAFVKDGLLDYPDQETLDFLRHASVASYMDRINIPVLLAQGEGDTLFNLNEAAATYKALRARKVPTSMIWHSWGHSDSSPAPGEFSQSDPRSGYESRLMFRWFAHYLKDRPVSVPRGFRYFRDWVEYDGSARPAYAHSSNYPVGRPDRLFLSGTDALVPDSHDVDAGTSTFAVTALGAPTSYSETSGVDPGIDPSDLPGTFAAYSSEPLDHAVKVAGAPKAHLRISAPLASTTGAAGPAGEVAVFVKIYDLAPDGTKTLPARLVAPVRAANLDDPVSVRLPAFVHRFPEGDRIQLVVAGGDAAYRGNVVAQPVSIDTDQQHPGTVTLPVVGAP
jgi:predicted acyl esterase